MENGEWRMENGKWRIENSDAEFRRMQNGHVELGLTTGLTETVCLT